MQPGSGQDCREWAVEKVGKARRKLSNKQVRSFPDLPVEQRIPRSFLFKVKQMLSETRWGYSKLATWIDTEAQQLWLGDDLGMTVNIAAAKLNIAYEHQWEEFFKDEEYDKLIAATEQRVPQAVSSAGQTKGKKGKAKGKGPSGQ